MMKHGLNTTTQTLIQNWTTSPVNGLNLYSQTT